MGASHSRDDCLDDSDDEPSPDASPQQFHSPPLSEFHSPSQHLHQSPNNSPLDLKLGSLFLNPNTPSLHSSQRAKLYRHLDGGTPKARWIVVEKAVGWAFVRDGEEDDDSQDEDNWRVDDGKGFRSWILSVGTKVRARVDARLQVKFIDDQLRADFVHEAVWALKFLSIEGYKDFVSEYMNCKFENTYLLEATEENKMKVFGKDFINWDQPEEADESAWEDAEDTFEAPPQRELKEAFTEPAAGGIQSLTMGALDHSFLVSDTGIEAVRNLSSGIQGKGVAVQFGKSLGVSDSYSTPKKAMLIRGESNMMLLSPGVDNLHSSGVHQLDIGTGKVVAEWKFEKDGTPITMRDVTNESKGAQLDPTGSTFLGLDDNRLCRWDMRDRHGMVQDLVSPVLNWAGGHQFARGTSFQCFATTGDGCVVVGSKDGKVRLYGTSSMRVAKTAFPGLGLPITHVDVTFDGKWVLATTDTYLILISTVFKDKDEKIKTGFSGRAGNKFAAPRLLKLTPVDAHLAGKNHKLRGGQFSWVTESGKQERHLVATAGMFTIIWNFRRVKESNHECYRHAAGLKSCYCYKIVPKDESVVGSKFMHDNYTTSSPEAPLVVATPKNVSSFNMWRD